MPAEPQSKHSSFTVVTPNFNMGGYLAETIESVLANLRPGDQYFVIDGGSTDDSVEIIKRYERHISGWISERDKGYADAIAKGFAKSTAEFQCWINCGDLLLAGCLDEARSRLETSGSDLIYGDDLYIDDQGYVIQVSNGHVDNLKDMMLYGGWTPLQDACYWRRSLYERCGGIDPDLKYAADFDLFLRLSRSGSCQYVPVIFSAFRQHEGQTSDIHSVGYRQERICCRQREISMTSSGFLIRSILSMEYWLKARLRARLRNRNDNVPQLIGKNVAHLHCQPNGERIRG